MSGSPIRRLHARPAPTGDDGLMDLDSAAEELYGVAPNDFIARRNKLAKQAAAEGDAAAAAKIRGLAKPKLSAWVVNNLVREDRDQMTALLDLGTALRKATEELRGDELAALSKQQRSLVNALTKQAIAAAEDAGQKVSPALARSVEQTLRAALADPDAAEQLAAGQLTDALEYIGFPGGLQVSAAGPAARTARTARTARGRKAEPAGDAAAETLRAARAEARDAAAAAKQGERAAQQALAEAAQKVELLGGHLEEVRRRVKELTEQLRAAEREQRAAAKDHERTAAELAAAEQQLAELKDR